MKRQLRSIPVPLQHQLLAQAALSGFCIIAAVVVWVFFSVTTAIPFLCGSLLLAVSATRLFSIAAAETYLALKGTVLRVERTPFRQRARALILEVDGKALRVVLRNRHFTVQPGDLVMLYISDTTPLYEWREIHQLHSYLALAREKSAATV